jgi:general secretion pathway protein D
MINRRILAAALGLAALVRAQAPAAPAVTAPQNTAPQTGAPQAVEPKPIPLGNMNLENASLVAVIDQLARLLKLNVIVDSAVKGTVTINTYGDASKLDARNMLEMILRINNAGLIPDGDLYRVIPLKSITHLPMRPEINQKNIPEDDQTILNMIFLKYVSVDELIKVLGEFKGENSDMIAYAPANLLFLLDSRRNMRRTMDLIAQFDSDAFANQRVRLYEVKNVKPSDVVKDLENIFKSISLDNKTSTVRFLPIDRINTMIAVAPNPGVFETITEWLGKLDVPVKLTAGTVEINVYKVTYGRAECLEQALTRLFNPGYGGGGGYGAGLGANGYANNTSANNGYGNGYANGGGTGIAGGGTYGNTIGGMGGGNAGGYGNQNSFNSGFGGAGGCNANGMGAGAGAGYGNGYNNAQAYGYPAFGGYSAQTAAANATGLPVGSAATAPGAGTAAGGTSATPQVIPPRIIANPLDNKLIIQADAQQYQNILKILKELDVPPRQILLEAKIYSVTLSDSFSSNITATLAKNGAAGSFAHQLLGSISSAPSITAGTIVGQSRQLLLALSANENRSYTKLLSEPSLIATDSIPASINVGTQVPVTTGSTVIPSGGTTTTSSSYSSQNTGVTLQVNARVNSSGVVTLIINQEISNVSAATTNAATPAFDQQVVQTQITMMDGDTIAIGGLISEKSDNATTGIPGLIRIPWIGALFGSKSVSKSRDELIMFFTPHVIFDETNLIEASDELKARVKMLKRDIRRL